MKKKSKFATIISFFSGQGAKSCNRSYKKKLIRATIDLCKYHWKKEKCDHNLSLEPFSIVIVCKVHADDRNLKSLNEINNQNEFNAQLAIDVV